MTESTINDQRTIIDLLKDIVKLTQTVMSIASVSQDNNGASTHYLEDILDLKLSTEEVVLKLWPGAMHRQLCRFTNSTEADGLKTEVQNLRGQLQELAPTQEAGYQSRDDYARPSSPDSEEGSETSSLRCSPVSEPPSPSSQSSRSLPNSPESNSPSSSNQANESLTNLQANTPPSLTSLQSNSPLSPDPTNPFVTSPPSDIPLSPNHFDRLPTEPNVSTFTEFTYSRDDHSRVLSTTPPQFIPPKPKPIQSFFRWRTVFVRNPSEKRKCWIASMLCLENNKLVMMDILGPGSIMLMDISPTSSDTDSQEIKLGATPLGIALLRNGLVAVTIRTSSICLLEVNRELVLRSQFNTEKQYVGIVESSAEETLVVSCHRSEHTDASVDVITRQGVLLNTLVDAELIPDLVQPTYLYAAHNHLYISDLGSDNQAGCVLFEVNMERKSVVNLSYFNLESPCQVCMDSHDNLYVASSSKNCVLRKPVGGNWEVVVNYSEHSDIGFNFAQAICITHENRLVVAWVNNEVPHATDTLIRGYMDKDR